MIPHVPNDSDSDKDWKRKVSSSVNALSTRLTQTGITAARPVKPSLGQMFYDSTIGKPCWWTGSAWHDASGTAV